MTLTLGMASVTSELPGVNDFCMGGVSGACLARWRSHHRWFPYVVRLLFGDSPRNHGNQDSLGIPCPETHAAYVCPVVTNNGICRQMLVKHQCNRFHENLFRYSPVVAEEQTDIHGNIFVARASIRNNKPDNRPIVKHRSPEHGSIVSSRNVMNRNGIFLRKCTVWNIIYVASFKLQTLYFA